MSITTPEAAPASELTIPLVVVSADAHVGPRLVEDLRAYCPSEHLEAYDEYTKAAGEWGNFFLAEHGPRSQPVENPGVAMGPTGAEMGTAMEKLERNLQSTGQYDPHEYLREMDLDGLTADAIFHASMNGEPIPFVPGMFGTGMGWEPGTEGSDMVAVGYRIYNRWLADFCSTAPERLLGVAHIPTWDVDAAVKEAEWAADAGLRLVNMPVPQRGIADYDLPIWEPFWSVCEAAGMTLATHAGGGSPPGSGMWAMMVESAAYGPRRAMAMMIFGGVFERHPNLHLVLSEVPLRNWWSYVAREYDSQWRGPATPNLPRPPSEYMLSNVFLGSSYAPREEVEDAVAQGYSDNIIWGRDYPHAEGTYDFGYLEPAEQNQCRVTLQWTFRGVDPEPARAMIGGNGVRAYHLDGDALAKVAARISAPTLTDVANAPDVLPDDWWNGALRRHVSYPTNV